LGLTEIPPRVHDDAVMFIVSSAADRDQSARHLAHLPWCWHVVTKVTAHHSRLIGCAAIRRLSVNQPAGRQTPTGHSSLTSKEVLSRGRP